MTQTRPSRPRIVSPGGRPGGAPPHHLQMELKQHTLATLGKLADRDTQQIALEELEKIVHGLSPDSVPVCLSCLYDSDGQQQKSVVKKECVRLFGTLASLYGDLLSPHLPKIIACIVRRLQDPDTSVRDACVDAMGVLSGRLLSSVGGRQESGGQTSVWRVFLTPLFDALSEQNKTVQIGAAMCLAKVVESVKPVAGLQRLCTRICKFLTNPNLLAKAALLRVIGNLSQVGVVGQQQLALLIPCVHECLESSDWATRKAAAETLGRMALNLGLALAAFKSKTLVVLESCRFDKVKPVRDSVHDATELWKKIPDAETDVSDTATKLETVTATEVPDVSPSMLSCEAHSSSVISNDEMPAAAVPDSDKAGTNDSSSENTFSVLKKRALALTGRKPNLDFFQKLEAKGSDDFQIEVAVPRSFPLTMPAPQDENLRAVEDADAHDVLIDKERRGASQSSYLHQSSGKEGTVYSQAGQTAYVGRFGKLDDSRDTSNLSCSPIRENTGNEKSRPRCMEANSWSNTTLQRDADVHGQVTSPASNGGYAEGEFVSGQKDWFFVRKQLSQLEHQQSHLMNVLQEYMGSSQEAMLSLDSRVRGLERLVEDMAQDLFLPSGRRSSGIATAYEGGGGRSGTHYLGSDYVNHKFGKVHENHFGFTQRLEAMSSGVGGVCEPTWRQSAADIVHEDWNDNAYGNSRSGAPGSYLTNDAIGLRRSNFVSSSDIVRPELGGEFMVNRKVWGRGSGSVRHGEGPSARSVWQASKDEATLTAIRGAVVDAWASETEVMPSGMPRLMPESGSNSLLHNNGGQGKGALSSLWSHVMECVHAGDIDSAYADVLYNGDDLMLMRLMSRTGPVVDELSASTSTAMLHAIGLLLQQPNCLAFGLPWIQQVADLIVDNGADCLGFPLDTKKELLLSLQEATSMNLPAGWLGNTIEQLLERLTNAWSIDLLQPSIEE